MYVVFTVLCVTKISLAGTVVLGKQKLKNCLATPLQSTGEITDMKFPLVFLVSLGKELFLQVSQKMNYGEQNTSMTQLFIRTPVKRCF